MAPSNTESDYPTPSTLDTSAPSTANPQPNGQVAVDFNKDNDKPTTGSSQATTDTMESKAKETVMRERRKEEDETNESEESEETPKKSRRKKKKTKKNRRKSKGKKQKKKGGSRGCKKGKCKRKKNKKSRKSSSNEDVLAMEREPGS
ncbi:hypothetical protein Q1695_011381 [Nippostrongylus brasiliensis]|nr:hypothetical protein Q1695_011381 [Nippostrongylus brasiliensis]